MIGIERHIANRLKFIEFCKSNQVSNSRLLGINMLALVKKRVTREGKDSSDSKIPGYSKVPVPSYWYKNKPRRSGAALSVLNDVDYLSYEEWRTANGLNVDKVTYFFTGDMWSSMKVAVISSTGSSAKVLIGPTGEENLKKFGGLTSRKGEFLRPTKSEQDILQRAFVAKKVNDLRAAG